MPTADMSASPDDVGTDRARRKSPPELDGCRDATAKANLESTHTMNDIHPLFPNVDPAYRTTHVPHVPVMVQANTHQNVVDSSHVKVKESPGGISPPRQATQWSRPLNLESRGSPFRQDQPPRHLYQANSNAPSPRTRNVRQHIDESRHMDPPDDNIQYDDDDTSLRGINISPWNADQRRQALAQRISLFDIARLGNVRYHGGTHGYQPLTEGIIHRCGYTEIISSDVLLAYNNIIEVHSRTCNNWEHPCGHYKGPQLNRILEKGLGSFPRLSKLEVETTVEFYDAFHKTVIIYLLPVMPFDCICIKMGFEVLCPPGLGIPWYAAITRVLMELLPRLLPRSDTQVS